MSKRLIKYSINTRVDAEDIIASTLFDYGIEGVEIEDKVGLTAEELEKQFVDIPLVEKDDGDATINFYVEVVDNENEKNVNKEANAKCTNNNHENQNSNVDFNSPYVDNSYKNTIYKQFTAKEIDILINDVLNELQLYKDTVDLGSLEIKKKDISDFDYMNKWKENFKKIYIDNLCIRPSFEELDDNDKDKIIINIDPKAAFGTGNHQTTRLCIEALDRFIKEMKVESLLDVGCGSGILGIIAKKLGVNEVLSIDVDDTIRATIEENVEMNQIKKEDFKFVVGNIIDDKKIKDIAGYEKYDIICANILAPVIIALITVGAIDKHMKKGGVLITSGILDKYENDIKEAIDRNPRLSLIDIKKKDEWLNFNIRKIDD